MSDPTTDISSHCGSDEVSEASGQHEEHSFDASPCEPIRSLSAIANKPHKAQDAHWEAIRSLAAREDGIRLSHFRLIQRLGSGDIGSVYLTQLRRTNCFFAMKVVDKTALESRKKLHRAQTEREILEILDHPFLPTLYSHIDNGTHSCLVMEFCPGGDLHVLRQLQPKKRFSDNAVRFYAAEVLLALEYLHMMGVVYRDLKPENVLVREDGHIMLSDFDLSLKCTVNPRLSKVVTAMAAEEGWASPLPPTSGRGTLCNPSGLACMAPLACVSPCSIHPVASCLPIPRLLSLQHHEHRRRSHKHMNSSSDKSFSFAAFPVELRVEPTSARSMSFVGTHEYLAPEIIAGDGHGSAVDWWTFGIFLYELLYGTTPFKGKDNETTLINVVTKLLKFPTHDDDDDDDKGQPCAAVRDLIRKLLVKDPQKRLAAVRGASEIKQQPFFEGVNWALVRCAVPPEIPSPFTLEVADGSKSFCSMPADSFSDTTSDMAPEFELFF